MFPTILLRSKVDLTYFPFLFLDWQLMVDLVNLHPFDDLWKAFPLANFPLLLVRQFPTFNLALTPFPFLFLQTAVS